MIPPRSNDIVFFHVFFHSFFVFIFYEQKMENPYSHGMNYSFLKRKLFFKEIIIKFEATPHHLKTATQANRFPFTPMFNTLQTSFLPFNKLPNFFILFLSLSFLSLPAFLHLNFSLKPFLSTTVKVRLKK